MNIAPLEGLIILVVLVTILAAIAALLGWQPLRRDHGDPGSRRQG